MAENPLFDLLIQRLATIDDPAAKAAIIAEIAFDQLPPTVATVARRCIILRWFDEAILAALLPEDSTLTADEVATQLAELPFVEKLAWGGLAYHDLTRTGLLARYGAEQPGLLKQAAALAVSAYQNYADQTLAGIEALFCLVVAGQTEEATNQLGRLINKLGEREAWDSLLAVFATRDQTEMLPFVSPLHRTAFHCFARGRSWQAVGQLDAAITDYTQAIALKPDYAIAYINRGNARRTQGKLATAITDYTQAIDLQPEDATAYYNRGIAYKDQSQLDAAITDYTQAIAFQPEDAAAYINRGNARKAQGQLDTAIADYTQAIALKPEDATAYNNRGNAHYAQGQVNAAIADYTQAIALKPEDATAYNNRGNVRSAQGQLDAAITDYIQATALKPEDATAYNNLGSALRLVGRWMEAEQAIQRALTLNPQDWTNWFVLADIVRRRGDMQAWQTVIEQARPLVDYTDVYNAACFESVAGNVDRALELLAQAAAQGQLDPDWAKEDPDLHWVRQDPRFWALIGEASPD